MSNLLSALPAFDLAPFTHILPSLERASISTADLLTIDALDVAKRAQVPPAEVRKLTDALLRDLHGDITASLKSPPTGHRFISTLDDGLDAALGGGVLCGQLTEIVGESAAGKTQFMLTLLLSVQLHSQHEGHNSDRNAALYISTEAPLQTTRLAQILSKHPRLTDLPDNQRPSLNRVHSTHVHDLEAQDHIINFQVPIAIEKHKVGLVIIDSIAANYRAEFDKSGRAKKGSESLAKRSSEIAQTCAFLRELARKHNIAIVFANQVADRFMPLETASQVGRQSSQGYASLAVYSQSSAPKTAINGQDTSSLPNFSTDDLLSLDHQQRFCTGWGDDPTVTNLKTPSLGLTLTNQLSARIALLKEPLYVDRAYGLGEERELAGWSRSFKIVFSAWCAESSTDFEIWEGGVRCRLPPVDGVSP